MLRYIAGAIVVGVGAYLLNEASSSNARARRDYDDTCDEAKEWIEHQAYHARRKDTLDKLFKIKRAKQKVGNTFHKELEQERKHLKKIDYNLKSMKESLSLLFAQKKESIERHKKRKLQEEINFIVASRKELFSLKSDLKENISKLSSRLKIANQETRSVQEQINNVLKN